ncbi:hypothetical protein BGX28_001728 [Mortierella sp. GBA30]|nr:hypothetical protein BGX28_001728 [Mortierella sp. GBA30]
MPACAMTGKDTLLYPHSTDFEGRPPPPDEGYSWRQIKDAIDSKSLHALRRTDKGQYEYEQWQAGIDRTRYRNVGEFIAFSILGWPDLVDPADSADSADITSESVSKEERYRISEPRLTLRLNHYPFPVQESIQYYVLWSTRDMSVPEELHRLEKYLKQQLEVSTSTNIKNTPYTSPEHTPAAPGKRKDWMWFVNPIELRSVATVHHIHVFVRDVDIEQ